MKKETDNRIPIIAVLALIVGIISILLCLNILILLCDPFGKNDQFGDLAHTLAFVLYGSFVSTVGISLGINGIIRSCGESYSRNGVRLSVIGLIGSCIPIILLIFFLITFALL